MCATCGCGHGEVRIEGVTHDTDHFKSFRPAAHAPDVSPARMVQIEQDILSKNNDLAGANRKYFSMRGIFALNMVSSPGSGKTTLLVRTITDLKGKLPVAVIEGDQETSNDAERIRATGAAAVQINTGRGCHLDAHMVMGALEQLKPAPASVLFIENVGNLVCPAAFDLGEAARVALFSVTEGEDKPLKYPDIFASADLVLINKVDLLPHLTYDMAKAEANVRRVNPRARIMAVSATSGEGLAEWYQWLSDPAARAAA
jgi:hydrogenase nickel incorporation protein HypB